MFVLNAKHFLTFLIVIDLGVKFNAWTDFRSTVYQIEDAHISDFHTIMNILYNQVHLVEFLNESLSIEKGVILGEERFRMNSSYIAMVEALKNHGGKTWKISQRFPIGVKEQLKTWTIDDLKQFQ